MNLKDLRQKIDSLDEKIIELLNQRTDLVLEIGKLKSEESRGVYSPERESEIYQKIEKMAKGALPKDALKSIYREVMSAALALEKALRIVYLGPEASFTHLAALSKFGSSVSYVSATTISEIFQEVDQKRADYGVIPVENSIEGAVTHSLDQFIDSELKISSEIFFEISHNLLSHSPLREIQRVYSNPQVFGQCRLWIESHLPRVELIETASTTQAAQRAAKEDRAAAIASKLAATLYDLPIVAEAIEDHAHNVTRFLVIGREFTPRTGRDKTSMVVSIKDKVGALYEMLSPIRKHKINMSKIESRPSKKKAWDYYFYIDFEGHLQDAKIKKMLDELEGKVRFLKILGSYPRASAGDRA